MSSDWSTLFDFHKEMIPMCKNEQNTYITEQEQEQSQTEREGELTEGETETERRHELLVGHDNAHRAHNIHSPCSQITH